MDITRRDALRTRPEGRLCPDPTAGPAASIDLYWLPLGASDHTHVVRTNGRVYEAVCAWFERRDRSDLFHAALEVCLGADRFTIEMAPAWGADASECGVVGGGSVGIRRLGRLRLFRYEVRRWRDGSILDVEEAIDSARRSSTDTSRAREVLALVPAFPTATWGRDELHTGDMWNSNSLIAWLLASSGHDMAAIRPPDGGRAPGWSAGLVVAARDRSGAIA